MTDRVVTILNGTNLCKVYAEEGLEYAEDWLANCEDAEGIISHYTMEDLFNIFDTLNSIICDATGYMENEIHWH